MGLGRPDGGPTRGRDAEAELSLRSRAQNGEGLLQRACLGVVGEVDAARTKRYAIRWTVSLASCCKNGSGSLLANSSIRARSDGSWMVAAD